MSYEKFTPTRWEIRRGCQLYRAGGDPDKCPMENPIPTGRAKWQALVGMSQFILSSYEAGFLWCVLDMANVETGYCWPKLEVIAQRSNRRCERSLKRAAASLKRKKLISIVTRKKQTTDGRWVTRNVYYINWDMLLAAFDKLLAVDTARAVARKEERDDLMQSGAADEATGGRNCHPPGDKRVLYNL